MDHSPVDSVHLHASLAAKTAHFGFIMLVVIEAEDVEGKHMLFLSLGKQIYCYSLAKTSNVFKSEL